MSGVKIVEVGARDGLQNISNVIPTEIKVELIERLARTGLSVIEATSFVSPKSIPQLADAPDVIGRIRPLIQASDRPIDFPVLVPNVQGFDLALHHGVKEVAVFISATEGFSQRNTNCSVSEALARMRQIAGKAAQHNIRCRGYVSCIFVDPYDGPTAPSEVIKVTKALLDAGCYEVSLGDTLGVGTPSDVQSLLTELLKVVPASRLAGHFHDTYGQAIANVVKSYEMGIRTFDSSIAGLGGCPYAKGAKGNLATEDIVYTMQKMGIATGVDLKKLVDTGTWISQQLRIPNNSRAGAALAAKMASEEIIKEPSPQSREKRNWTLIESTSEYTVSRCKKDVTICLTRPRNGNALTLSMINGLTQLFNTLSKDTSVFRLILTAQGKYFCTGMDLTNKSITPDQQFHGLQNLFGAIDACPQTTIAAINGPCFGGGVGLAFVCDIRLVSASSFFQLSEVRLGLCPAVISKFIVREWGISFARAAMLTARKITPSELRAIGVVQSVVKDTAALQVAVEELLDDLRFAAPGASTLCKGLVRQAWVDGGGHLQDLAIKAAFDEMMAEGSESKHGLVRFGKGGKGVEWGALARYGPQSKL